MIDLTNTHDISLVLFGAAITLGAYLVGMLIGIMRALLKPYRDILTTIRKKGNQP